MKYFNIYALVAALCTLSQPSPAEAQACSFVWEEASKRIASECTDRIRSNTMCYGYETLVTEPAFPDFTIPGQRRAIDRDLVSIEANLDGGLGGFSFMKVIAGKPVEGLPIGQAVIMVAFGDTGLRQIISRQAPMTEAQAVCTAELRRNSTTYGGSYIRAIPDPRHQVECATQPCPDKNNLLYFVREGEPLEVLGRDNIGSTLLVRNRFATGWMSASSTYVRLNGCGLGGLPVYSDDVVSIALATAVDLPVTSQFVLVNTPTRESLSCIAQDRPAGGLLILNASHQNLVFSVNSIEISIASSVLIMSHYGVTRIVVLAGTAEAITPLGQLRAVAGETIAVTTNVPPLKLSEPGRRVGWCDNLRRLAEAAYGQGTRLPEERLDYCGSAPGGYLVFDNALARVLGQVDRPQDGLSSFGSSDVDVPTPIE